MVTRAMTRKKTENDTNELIRNDLTKEQADGGRYDTINEGLSNTLMAHDDMMLHAQ